MIIIYLLLSEYFIWSWLFSNFHIKDYYNFTLCDFFTLALDGYFFHWSLLNSPGHFLIFLLFSKKLWGLDGIDSSSDLQLTQSFFQAFVKSSKHTNYFWYHHHPHAP